MTTSAPDLASATILIRGHAADAGNIILSDQARRDLGEEDLYWIDVLVMLRECEAEGATTFPSGAQMYEVRGDCDDGIEVGARITIVMGNGNEEVLESVRVEKVWRNDRGWL